MVAIRSVEMESLEESMDPATGCTILSHFTGILLSQIGVPRAPHRLLAMMMHV